MTLAANIPLRRSGWPDDINPKLQAWQKQHPQEKILNVQLVEVAKAYYLWVFYETSGG